MTCPRSHHWQVSRPRILRGQSPSRVHVEIRMGPKEGVGEVFTSPATSQSSSPPTHSATMGAPFSPSRPDCSLPPQVFAKAVPPAWHTLPCTSTSPLVLILWVSAKYPFLRNFLSDPPTSSAIWAHSSVLALDTFVICTLLGGRDYGCPIY